MARNHFVMRKLDTTEKVTMRNGRMLYVKYERVKVNDLPPKI